MQESEDMNPAEREFVEALKGLELAPLQTSSRWIWYQAGLRTGRRRATGWGALAATTLAVALLIVRTRQMNAPVERYVSVQQESAPAVAVQPAAETASTTSLSTEYLRLCNEIIQEQSESQSPQHFSAGAGDYMSPSRWPKSERDSDLSDQNTVLKLEDGI
jgi:hypothetical protein